jgi:hypothetical protein
MLLYYVHKPIQHKCKQQKATSLHSTHSETIGACDATKETLYVQDICAFHGIDKDIYRPTPLYIDSQPCIDSLQANTVTTRQKHIVVPIHFIHEQIENGRVELRKIGTTLNLADSGTKPIPSSTHFRHCDHIIDVRFCPPPDSEHYRLLELHNFIKSPCTKEPEVTNITKSDDLICSESTSDE